MSPGMSFILKSYHDSILRNAVGVNYLSAVWVVEADIICVGLRVRLPGLSMTLELGFALRRNGCQRGRREPKYGVSMIYCDATGKEVAC